MPAKKAPVKTIQDIQVKVVTNNNDYGYLDVDDIPELARTLIREKEGTLQREGLRQIHPSIHAYYNSINLFVGRQGTGKTHSAMTEIGKICCASPQTCMVVYVTKEGDKCDDTVEALKDFITIPIAYVKEEDAEIYVKDLQEYMNFYKDIKDNHWERMLDPAQRDEVCNALHIKNFDQPFLHIIILFEDFANNSLVKKPDSFFSQFIATLRHRGFSVFICVQFWRSISTTIKSNIAVIYLFSGYSLQQLQFIAQQIPGEIDKQDLYRIYKTLGPNDRLVINTLRQSVSVDTS
jgi:hypothetical protein